MINTTIQPENEEVQYPYRRVWRSVAIEIGVLFVFTMLAVSIQGAIQLEGRLLFIVNLAMVSVPLFIWVITSLLSELFSQQPRDYMLVVVVVAMLVAQGVSMPLIYNYLAINDWVYTGSLFEKIVQYMIGVAIFHEVLKYLVIRYTTWQHHLRTRYDAVAYVVAISWAYVFVLNLNRIAHDDLTLGAVAVSSWSLNMRHLMTSLIVSYGIAESRLKQSNPVFLPFLISFAALIHAIVITLENVLNTTRITLDTSVPRTILSILLPLVAILIVIPSMVFLFRSSEQKDLDRLRGEQ